MFSLYLISLVCGGIAVLCERLNRPVLLPMLVVGVAISLWQLGAYLSRFTNPLPAKASAQLRDKNLDAKPT